MRKLLGLSIGAVIGGLVGYSQVLCGTGGCALTGSWYVGAILGGLVGFILAGGCPACAAAKCDLREPDTKATPPPPGPA